MLGIVYSILVASSFVVADTSTDRWDQWRGPSRSGFVAEGPEWPHDLNGLQVHWKKELGPGYSGPLVVADTVYVAETEGEKDEVVRALDRETGNERWRNQWQGSMKVPFFAKENGDWIRSTPACDGETIYVGGMRDMLVALDTKTGQIRWTIDFVKDFKSSVPTFGFVSSPLIVGPHLYVQAGGSFFKIDKATGGVVWKSLADGGGMMGSAFSSPVLQSIGGQEQLLVQTRTKLAGVRPEDGTVLWTQDVPNFRGMNILTPIVFNDGIFTSSYQNKSYFYLLDHQDGTWRPSVAWENKVKGYMSTPILIDGHVYLHLQNQRMACLRLTDGELKWVSSRRFGKYWSMVAHGNKILGLDQDGTLFLMQADPAEFKILAEKKISEQETWGHLAVVGNEVFVRELKGISAWNWLSGTAQQNR
ncbi:PQQ-like beta-propeller repeat protein [bacterium]|nr:PQQ-like beta-propeller repeat protein [bacterium]